MMMMMVLISDDDDDDEGDDDDDDDDEREAYRLYYLSHFDEGEGENALAECAVNIE